MEVNDTVPAALAYVGAVIGPEDFIDDVALSHILALLEENTCWAAEKAEDSKREAMLLDEIFIDLDSYDEL
jgi:hypothetical protein